MTFEHGSHKFGILTATMKRQLSGMLSPTPRLQVMTCLTHGKLGGTPAAGELVLETLTCCLGAAEPAQRRHVPGAALVLGALLVSHRRAADGAPPKLGLLLENLQVGIPALCEG